ncbi:MAG: glycine zipper 2TM domain-containing protein [Acidobacteria bacterium]|nr:glycine zipper 2TM domain-containing protein [Acidobacteriota bacterium]
MPTSPIRHVLTVSLCAAALWAGACNRDHNQPQPVQTTANRQTSALPLQNAPASTPQGNELNPAPQSVAVGNAPSAGAAGDLNAREQELADQERQLGERQAELSSREQQIADRERALAERPAAPAPSGAVARTAPPAPPSPPMQVANPRLEPRAVNAIVPAGTRLSVALGETLTSRGSRVGQRVRARVVSPVSEHGVVVIPRGSELLGEVTAAGSPRRLGGRAILGVRFTELVLPSGGTVPIQASFAEQGRNRSRRSAAIVGGTAAGGAIIGHNVHDSNRSRGTLVGALLGAAVGSAIAANVPGPDVVVPRGAVIRVRLRHAVGVRAGR